MAQRGIGFWVSLFLLYGFHATAALWTERALWGDGAHYFSRILETRWFFTGDSSRAGADLLVQFPLVLALSAGVTDLPWLKLLFGLPPFTLAPACIALCLWMAGPNKALVIYPLATVAAGLMNTELLVIHESRTALALFWPVLFGLVDPKRRMSSLLVAAALSIPFIASYESALVLGPILGFTAFQRWRRESSWSQRAGVLSCLVAALASVWVAADSVVHPRHPANFEQFQETWRVLLDQGSVGTYLSLFVLVLGAASRHHRPGRQKMVLGIALLAACAGILLLLGNPQLVAVHAQYRARFLNVALPLIASCAVLRWPDPPAAKPPLQNLLGILIAAQVFFQVQLTDQWSSFRRIAREQLDCARGLLPADVALASRLSNLGLSTEWMHGWEHPTLSLLDRAGPVRSLLGNSRDHKGWQPFDPLRPDEVPDLSRYGIETSEYLSIIPKLVERGGSPWEYVTCGQVLERKP